VTLEYVIILFGHKLECFVEWECISRLMIRMRQESRQNSSSGRVLCGAFVTYGDQIDDMHSTERVDQWQPSGKRSRGRSTKRWMD